MSEWAKLGIVLGVVAFVALTRRVARRVHERRTAIAAEQREGEKRDEGEQ